MFPSPERKVPILTSILRGTGSIAFGTALGQGIILAVTPLLARHYSPADFGALALLMTVSNIATAVACARYDLALPGASVTEAPILLRLTSIVASVLSGLVFIVMIVAAFISDAPWPSPFNAAWLVALCVLLVGFQQIAIGSSTRERLYINIGAIRFAQGSAFAFLAVLPGVGLIAAHALSFVVAFPTVIKRLRGTCASVPQLIQTARDRRDFPIVSLPGALLDVVGYSACIWIVVHFFGAYDAGQFSQIQRVLGAPLMLIAISAAQVLLRTGVDYVQDRESMVSLMRNLCIFVGIVALILVSAVVLVGEPFLEWLLGDQWRVDASFVVPITVAVTVRACVSPISTLLISMRRFDIALIWQIIYFVSSVVVLSLAASNLDINGFVLVYAVHETVLYSIYVLFIAKAIRSLPCAASSA
jgi:O-antigen/teichoic acid export membrane protein